MDGGLLYNLTHKHIFFFDIRIPIRVFYIMTMNMTFETSLEAFNEGLT